MQPINHPLCNTTLERPEGWTEEQCNPLPVRRGDGIMTSYWKPSEYEIALLSSGGSIALAVTGGHPPVILTAVPGGVRATTKEADSADRINTVTVACADQIELGGIKSHELPIVLGKLAAVLSSHTGTPLKVVLHMVETAARRLSNAIREGAKK
ncbi:hypothetical protein JIN85_17035 [Luteolibacter pohnpeiensis]|uniref:Uncharacterized protein n=1 Tax=Luteolibacter pohnpeiensis TaxID=454153 RepID=A0A934S974_9BACT|nr:hypothetical protein [Luteolibacter pohnpeiensis]MBK1884128.1 hypothetical protein [Luteolibacter pohnpeiensis]